MHIYRVIWRFNWNYSKESVSAAAHGGWWAGEESLGRGSRGLVGIGGGPGAARLFLAGAERLHRICDEEGMVRRRHGGALGHLDPIKVLEQDFDRVDLGGCGPGVGPCQCDGLRWSALSMSSDLVGS
jgi:hypothetical protein